MAHGEPVSATCPRCGYDLRGTVATWERSCPLEGTCQECGLTFGWVDVFFPDRFQPRWCVEYAPPWRFLRACFSTLARSCAPWILWKRLHMEHEFMSRRVALYMVFLAALMYTAFASGHGAAALTDYLNRQARAAWWPAPPPPVQPTAGPFRSIAWAVAMPFSNTSAGIIDPSGVQATEPLQLIHKMYGLRGGRGPSELLSLVVLPAFPSLVLLVAAASFSCLPITLRRASVQRHHIVRAAAYGAIVVVAVTAMSIFWRVLGAGTPYLAGAVMFWTPLLFFIWWWIAVRGYMKLPHAAGVSAATVIIGWLVAIAIGYYLVPGFTFIVFGWGP